MEPNEKESEKKKEKLLVDHCKRLLKESESKKPTDKLRDYENFFLGRTDDNSTQNKKSFYNISNPIIETKVSLAMDSDVTTSVNAVIGALSNIEEIKTIEDISDIMNDINDYINRENKLDKKGRVCIRDMIKFGVCFAEVSWDQSKMQGLGDVCIQPISPMNAFPDPNAASISECNYFIIKMDMSSITLKKKYPQKIEMIDRLMGKSNEKSGDPSGDPRGRVTYKTDNSASQVYVNGAGGLDSLSSSISVYKCYLRDDSTFIPKYDDTSSETAETMEIGFKYPYGRVIIFAGDDCIFEDKPLEIESDILPIASACLYETSDIWAQGDMEKLIPIQKRYNNAFMRLSWLVASYISTIMVDPITNILNESNFINQLVTIMETGTLAKMPVPLTNNTLSQIQYLMNLLEVLKNEAKEVARVNDIMISGETSSNVKSGKMVDSLVESPMTSIREIQNSYYEFLQEISNMSMRIAQSFYNIPRILRISGGKKFISLNPASEGIPASIEILEYEKESKKIMLVEEIKGDLSLFQFECEVNTGRKMPRSRGATADITLMMWEKGVFGDPLSYEAVKILMESLDYPNYHKILNIIENAAKERSEMPIPSPVVEKMVVGFDQLPIDAQMKLLVDNGLIDSPEKEVQNV